MLTLFHHMAHWLLRLTFSSVFIYHGVGKFMTLESFAVMMMIPVWLAAVVATAEVLGGGLVVLGGLPKLTSQETADRLTRFGGALIAPVMVGAITLIHWGQWSFVPSDTHPMGGMEFPLLLMALSLFWVCRGNEL